VIEVLAAATLRCLCETYTQPWSAISVCRCPRIRSTGCLSTGACGEEPRFEPVGRGYCRLATYDDTR
jgi:hypothetical protein